MPLRHAIHRALAALAVGAISAATVLTLGTIALDVHDARLATHPEHVLVAEAATEAGDQ